MVEMEIPLNIYLSTSWVLFLFNMGGLVLEYLRISTEVLPESRPMSSSHKSLIWTIIGLVDRYF